MKYKYEDFDWSCPAIEVVDGITTLDQDILKNLCQVEFVEEEMRRISSVSSDCIGMYKLPLWQNLETVALGTVLKQKKEAVASETKVKQADFWLPGQYIIEEAEEFAGLIVQDTISNALNLVSTPLLQTVIEVIKRNKAESIILEVEAPFSVLGALMNPMDLYEAMYDEDDKAHVKKLLKTIAELEASYIIEAIKAGCSIISMADPLGTMNMVGEDMYKEVIAESERYFLHLLDPYLDEAVVHLCKKMSQSLLVAGFMNAQNYELPIEGKDLKSYFTHLAGQKEIHMVGNRCIHQQNLNLGSMSLLFFGTGQGNLKQRIR